MLDKKKEAREHGNLLGLVAIADGKEPVSVVGGI
jgi:hypothetical protein